MDGLEDAVGGAAMMGMTFAINGWAACAPGLSDPAAWRAWARTPALPERAAAQPTLADMPPMLRRRLGPLGRMAAQVAWQCQGPDLGMPVVLASRYGDAERALKLLTSFACDDEMSPTDFALSVHNAIGAMYSIARADTAAYSSVAAGASSPAAGLLEAAALLQDGAPEVLLVCYDAPLPGDYAGFEAASSCAYAWSWRVAAAEPGQPGFSMTWTATADAAPAEPALPLGLDMLRFALSDDMAQLTRRFEGTQWTWSRT
jgi:hypothetical protein